MTSKRLGRKAAVLAIGLAALAMATSPSFAQTTYDLAAVEGTWTAPDGVTTIPMWGFVPDTGSCPTPGAWVTPAPLTATAGDTLTINLRNCLPATWDASVFIPGQYKATSPVTFMDGQGRTRARSFDAVVAPGGTGSYTWNSVKEGTYLIQTGTQPQVGVQMGLYGSLVVSGGSYPAAVTEHVLLYSEIDPALHAAVQGGTYGTSAYPSTFDYHPTYYLINGQVTPPGAFPVTVGQDAMLRIVSACLKIHQPTLGGGLYMNVFAEDGNLYPFPVEQYSVQLPPGKTFDAIVNTPGPGTYAVYDRSLGLMNGTDTGGGMRASLVASAAAGAPVAFNDPGIPGDYTIAEGSSLVATALGSPAGVLDNDTGPAAAAVLVDAPVHGVLVGGLLADGSFTYNPDAYFNGTDQFTYVANDGLGGPNSNVATATITVTPVNDPPVAVADAYDVVEGQILSVAAPGVLGNDTDPDGDMLTAATSGVTPAELTAFGADGSFTFDASLLAAGAIVTFDYVANDGLLPSPPATVTITVIPTPPDQAPVAVDDFVSTPKNTVTPINVVANDYDPDGVLNASVMLTSTTTNRGGSLVVGGGIVTYTPPNAGFRGTDEFTYWLVDNVTMAPSNLATVRINVTK